MVFGLFSGPLAFDSRYATANVSISSDGRRGTHTVQDDLGGVLFFNQPLTFTENFAYFEVCVEDVCSTEDDGLTLGVSTQLPPEPPMCADDVEPSWSAGFDGRAHIDETQDLMPTSWNPKDLRVGDLVGFLVTADGAACVVVNRRKVTNLPGVVPQGVQLFGFVDLLGNTKSVSLIPDAQAPEQLRGFCMQTLKDETTDLMYQIFAGTDPEAVDDIVCIAELVGLPEKMVSSARKAMYKGPERPKARAAPKKAGWKVSALPAMAMGFMGKKKGGAAQGSSEDAAAHDHHVRHGAYASNKRGKKGWGQARGMMFVVKASDRASGGKPSPFGLSMSELKSANSTADGSQDSPVRKSGAKHKVIKKRVTKKSSSAAAGPVGTSDAAKDIQAALDAGSVEQAKQAVQAAQAAGIDAAEIARAEAGLAELEKKQKQALLIKAMDDALLSMDPAQVKASVSNAKSVGVSAAEIARVEKALTDMMADSAKMEKLKALAEAHQAKNVDGMKAALAAAKGAGATAADLAKYEDALKELEVTLAMEAALKSRDIEKLKASVTEAQRLGIDPASMSRFEDALRKLQAEADLNAAIASADIEKLKVAISAAQKVGVDAKEIARAEQAIKVKHMDLALESADIEKVKAAIAEAKTAGVDAKEIARGEQGLRQLEADAAKTAALVALQEALQTKSIDAIKAALSHAKEVQAPPEKLADAEKILQDLIRKFEEAKTALTDAMAKAQQTDPPTVELLQMLKQAEVEAKKHGVDTTEAEALHVRLVEALAVAKKKAEEDLMAAMESKDAEDIKAKLALCRSFGSDEAIAAALVKLGEIIKAEMQKAHEVAREDKMDMLPGIEALLNIFRVHAPTDPLLRKLHNDMQDLKGALRVYCRVRPLNKRELALNDVIVVEATSCMDVNVTSSKGVKEKFSYDNIFTESNTQEDVFEECLSLIQSAFDGYKITIFTYGQTGAGKTWTLYGIPELPGVSPRTCTAVFDVVARDSDKYDFEISAAMVELYNSNVRDLLSNEKPPPVLKIGKEKAADGSTAVKLDCTMVPAKSVDDLEGAVAKGFGNRKVASTSMNADSSRSHLMFMIFANVTEKETGKTRVGKITIVDLAGSERLAKSQVTGDQQKEAIEINKSLTALGDVMMAITSGAKMIPYRNHRLTELMQDSLGGSAKTLMFVNISPASNNADETINALKYASRARSIENEVKRDGNPKAKAKGMPKKTASKK